MDETIFHQIFDLFDYPAILKAGESRLLNPAAQSLCLSQGDLEQLETWGANASMWLARQFYHVLASRLGQDLLLILQPDLFLTQAAENVTSQLRAQLHSAFGAVTSLGENKALRADPRAREELSTLNRELYRILRIATQLERCTLSEPELSRTISVDLAQRLRHLAEELKSLCGQAGVCFTAEIGQDSLCLLADGRQLDYMILSLVSNALKNLPERDGRVCLSLKQQRDLAVITVSDNAGGFPTDYLSNPLWNDPHRLLPRRGLGLGLPLAQRIAAAHSGTLMVFPSPKGSRVVISLPIRQPDEMFSQPPLPVEDAPGFSLSKILLSDALPAGLYFPDPYGDDE